MKTKHCTLSLLTAALIAAGGAAIAATDTITVTADVVAACAIDTVNDLSFGGYSPVSASAVDAQTSIAVRCTNGSPYSIGLDLGVNADGSTRRMVHGTEATEFLSYELYSDDQRSTVWGNADGSWVEDTGTGSAQSHAIYGRIAASQGAAVAGSYSDTVTITVSY